MHFANIWGNWDKIFEKDYSRKYILTILKHMQMSPIFSITHYSDCVLKRIPNKLFLGSDKSIVCATCEHMRQCSPYGIGCQMKV